MTAFTMNILKPEKNAKKTKLVMVFGAGTPEEVEHTVTLAESKMEAILKAVPGAKRSLEERELPLSEEEKKNGGTPKKEWVTVIAVVS